ncbi:MAG: molybdopterin molybdotransferase MoeA [Actinomycetia bacterium]|nr:molybdopterin molybdotransferase MoeA [Actinomycetes bacterium]
MAELLELREAQALVLDRIAPTGAERVPIERAAGRVLAEPVAATCDLPRFPSSAMDGFAVRWAPAGDESARLRVVGVAAAGTPSARPLGPGEAITISTGAVVPEGAAAVVPIEHVSEADGVVTVLGSVALGDNIRRPGLDVAAGDLVLEPGVRLGPAQVAALAAAGASEAQCRSRPRVGVLVTGSELRPPGSELGPGEIYESNGLMLAAQLVAAGAVPAQLGVVPDDRGKLEQTIERALLGFDMLVTSGGASAGERDLVREAQAAAQVEEVFHGVAIKPGKPVGFGMRRSHPVFNLPGNPVSSLVCFELLVRPAVNALLGLPEPLPAFDDGTLVAAIRRGPRRDEYVRASTRREGSDLLLEPATGQESHMIVSTAKANALVHVPRGDGELAIGDRVRFLPL